MKKFDKGYFEKEYKRTKKLIWGKEPSKITRWLNSLVKKKSKILDLGCGEGKDALFLAKQGHKVTAVDISKSAINKLKERAKKEKMNIETEVADLSQYKIKEIYDAIIALASIHFLKKNQVYRLIKEMKKRTKKKGFNVIVVFRKKDPSSRDFKMYYFDNGELSKIYSDWEIVNYREYQKKDKHGENGKIHYHKNADLIAQKLK